MNANLSRLQRLELELLEARVLLDRAIAERDRARDLAARLEAELHEKTGEQW